MKKFVCCLLLTLPAFSLAAFDIGAIIENTTSVVTAENNTFFQKDKVSLWALFDLSETAAINMEGYYRFHLQEPYHAYALDRLELSVDIPAVESGFLFGFGLGRLRIADFTGHIVNHPVDGVRLVYKNSFMNAELAGGYTGFLFKGDSSLVMSIEDQNYESPVSDAMPLVPPRLVGVLNLNFPEAFLYQTLDLTVAGQLDLHDDGDVLQPGPAAPDYNNGGKMDSLYAGLGLSGPLFPNVNWEIFGVFEYGRTLSYVGIGYEYAELYAFLAGLKLEVYFPTFWKSKLTVDVIAASGDGDYENYLEGNTDTYSLQFIPITRPAIGLVFAQQLTNLIVGRIEYSFKPFITGRNDLGDRLQMALTLLTYFRAARSDVSDSRGLNSGSDEYYLGSEVDLVTGFKPFSDLGLELALGIFLPNNYSDTSAFSPDGRNIEFLARFMLVFEI